MWPECLRLGIAAITYRPFTKVNLSEYVAGEPKHLWEQLKPTQKASLRRVAYEMKSGDVIYVKQGPEIIDRGIVQGTTKRNAYIFDSDLSLREPNGKPWAHQVPVKWARSFPRIRMLLGGEQVTVKELSAGEVKRLEKAVLAATGRNRGSVSRARPGNEALVEAAYYRESPERLNVIVPRHNKLSNKFVNWLRKNHRVAAVQEQGRIDILFRLKGTNCLAELKTCFGVGTTKSIREALGQLLEYNHYPKRHTADVWLAILDVMPSKNDFEFVKTIREKRSLPIVIGWCENKDFRFNPTWP